jgi:bacterioferritin
MDKQVDILNKVLSGEHIATDFYKIIIEKVDNEELRRLLEQIQKQHQKHALNITQRIREIGGDIKDGMGFKAWLAESMLKLQTLGKLDELDALMMLYNGEDKGIASTEKFLDELDKENKQLVEENLSDDQDHLKILRLMINQMESRSIH